MKYLAYAIELMVLVSLVMCYDLGRSYIVDSYGMHPLLAGVLSIVAVVAGLLAIWGFHNDKEDKSML